MTFEQAEQATIESLCEALCAVIKPCTEQTADEATQAALTVLRRFCEAEGMKPDIETFLVPRRHWGQPAPGACWESGPSHWGVAASMAITVAVGRLCETFYGFDVLFFDWE